jgi:hypothetical protein
VECKKLHPSLSTSVYERLWIVYHEVSIEKSFRRNLSQTFDHWGTKRKIGDKVVVHYVKVNPKAPIAQKLTNLFRKD